MFTRGYLGVGSVQHPFLVLLGGGPRAGDLTWDATHAGATPGFYAKHGWEIPERNGGSNG